MGIEDVLKYARPDSIDLGEYDVRKFGLIMPSGLIMLNALDTEPEQLAGLVHELLHMDAPYVEYTRGLWAGTRARDEKIEHSIEDTAQEVVRSRPDIVDYLTEVLRRARGMQPRVPSHKNGQKVLRPDQALYTPVTVYNSLKR